MTKTAFFYRLGYQMAKEAKDEEGGFWQEYIRQVPYWAGAALASKALGIPLMRMGAREALSDPAIKSRLSDLEREAAKYMSDLRFSWTRDPLESALHGFAIALPSTAITRASRPKKKKSWLFG